MSLLSRSFISRTHPSLFIFSQHQHHAQTSPNHGMRVILPLLSCQPLYYKVSSSSLLRTPHAPSIGPDTGRGAAPLAGAVVSHPQRHRSLLSCIFLCLPSPLAVFEGSTNALEQRGHAGASRPRPRVFVPYIIILFISNTCFCKS
jgi:hypothetical protein